MHVTQIIIAFAIYIKLRQFIFKQTLYITLQKNYNQFNITNARGGEGGKFNRV